jgi:membrane protein implicated in regulation of membrane protease activity
MIWMALLMGLPLFGLALFFGYPWRVALAPYLILMGLSLFFDALMMRAMRLRIRCGREEMVGSRAMVLNWKGQSGQVIWNDEIWQAVTEGRTSFARGDNVVIDSVSGLSLSVKPVAPAPYVADPHSEVESHT